MSSQEERERHYARRKNNVYAKVLRDQSDYKGAFSLKVIEPKNKYKREKLTPQNIHEVETEDE